MNDWTPIPTVRDAVVDGVDVDAVAAAARACPGVEQLHGGDSHLTATYLPGRRVLGVRIEQDTVVVQVRARWGVPAPELAAQVRDAIGPVVNGRRIDIIVADVGDPPPALPPRPEFGTTDPLLERDQIGWTTMAATTAPSAASSSSGTIPTVAATPPPSLPV